MSEDFYIGYQPKMPPKSARMIKSFVGIALLVAVTLTAVIWIAQKPFAASYFEFGRVREFSGTIQAQPIPFLLVENDKTSDGLPRFERFPLVGEGKHGFAGAAFDGNRVRLRGTLIYRDELRMIEVSDGSIETENESGALPADKTEQLGQFTLRGEIVDSKCFLGVMNPGQSKPHRDCAVACLRGGIPALFVVRDSSGDLSELWLLSKDGGSINAQILDYVAEPVEISGEVSRLGDQLFFRIDRDDITRQ